MSSHYLDYLVERQQAEIIETEFGFVAYRIVGPECFIVEMFVPKHHRGRGHARELISKLEEIAKKRNCEAITGNIHLNDPGCSVTIRAALNLGFEIMQAHHNILLVSKKLGE